MFCAEGVRDGGRNDGVDAGKERVQDTRADAKPNLGPYTVVL